MDLLDNLVFQWRIGDHYLFNTFKNGMFSITFDLSVTSRLTWVSLSTHARLCFDRSPEFKFRFVFSLLQMLRFSALCGPNEQKFGEVLTWPKVISPPKWLPNLFTESWETQHLKRKKQKPKFKFRTLTMTNIDLYFSQTASCARSPPAAPSARAPPWTSTRCTSSNSTTSTNSSSGSPPTWDWGPIRSTNLLPRICKVIWGI